jgi:hypothetical protein
VSDILLIWGKREAKYFCKGRWTGFSDLPVSLGRKLTSNVEGTMSACPSILLQKSKVASARIFGETLKRKAIDDSDNLSRVPKSPMSLA